MKIKELLELDQTAPAIMPQVKQDFEKGSDAMDRLLNPKRWFGAGKGTDEKKHASNVEIRDSLNAAASGRAYMDDINVLKQVLAGLKDGTYKTADPNFSIKAVKIAMNSQPLSKEQAADLQALAKTF